jgi:hypothetical protein
LPRGEQAGLSVDRQLALDDLLPFRADGDNALVAVMRGRVGSLVATLPSTPASCYLPGYDSTQFPQHLHRVGGAITAKYGDISLWLLAQNPPEWRLFLVSAPPVCQHPRA